MSSSHQRLSCLNISWANLLLLLLASLSATLQITQAQNSCSNPNGSPGECTSLYDCADLFRLVQKNSFTTSQRSFLAQSQCQNGVGRQPYVCCTNDIDFRTKPGSFAVVTTPSSRRPNTPNVNPSPSNGKGNVLPVPPNCGPLSLSDKIYGGNNTALDDYPWMVLLAYRERNGKTSFRCGGSLINQRYVLTAAHCLTGKIETQIGPLVKVRLGEYDISKEIDCVLDDCNHQVVEVNFEETIPHAEFDPYNANQHHDIGLIRLEREVTLSDFIRPVCLPLQRTRMALNTGNQLFVAGWGRTLKARESNIKQHLSLLVTEQTSCRQKFNSLNINIVETQVCAGGEYRKDSCDGDSGGPLMRKQQNRWYLEGIVSFGHHCGFEDWPGVYTRVSEYVDWIQQNLKP